MTPRSTAWSPTSSPRRSTRPARSRRWWPRSPAARRWRWCWRRPRSSTAGRQRGRPRGAAHRRGRDAPSRPRGSRPRGSRPRGPRPRGQSTVDHEAEAPSRLARPAWTRRRASLRAPVGVRPPFGVAVRPGSRARGAVRSRRTGPDRGTSGAEPGVRVIERTARSRSAQMRWRHGDPQQRGRRRRRGQRSAAWTTTSTTGCSRSGSSSWAPRSATTTPTRSAPQLLLLAAEDPDKDIWLYINSPGGSVTAGMAIFDTMQWVQPRRRDLRDGPGRVDGPVPAQRRRPGQALRHAARADHDAPALRRHRRHRHRHQDPGRADAAHQEADGRSSSPSTPARPSTRSRRTPTATAGSPPSRPRSTASSTTSSSSAAPGAPAGGGTGA